MSLSNLSVEMKVMQAMPLERAVADFYGVHPKVINSTSRKKDIVKIRQIAQWLRVQENLRYKGRPHWNEVVKHFPKKDRTIDHATIIHSFRTVNNHIETEKKFREEIYELQKFIFGKVKY